MLLLLQSVKIAVIYYLFIHYVIYTIIIHIISSKLTSITSLVLGFVTVNRAVKGSKFSTSKGVQIYNVKLGCHLFKIASAISFSEVLHSTL